MSITLENGRINLDSLVTIEDHLRGLALANRRWTVLKTKCLSVPIKNQTGTDLATVACTNHGSGLLTNLRTTGYFAPSGKGR
jgi:hypothetical protein